jgi:hypothetical protein
VVLEQSHRVGLGAGRTIVVAAGMALILAVSAAGLRRELPAAASGDDPSHDAGSGGMARRGAVEALAQGAESVVGLVRSVPGPVTAMVAVLAGCGAFSHAETGRAGSVLAGLVEAAAVVAGVRLFGPALDLSRRPDQREGSASSSDFTPGCPIPFRPRRDPPLGPEGDRHAPG